MLSPDKAFYEKLSKKELSEKEVFEARDNFVGLFDLLFRIDRRINEQKAKNDLSDSSAGST